MNKAEVKAAVCRRIEEHSAFIEDVSRHIMRNPEMGFREHRTAAFVAGKLDELGIPYRDGLALTGIKAVLPGRTSGPTIAVIGELDALMMPDHEYADPVTGAAHACGHHAQLASMLGSAIGLGPVMRHLDGNVALFAVPAEECVDVEWRLVQRAEQKLEFLVGKAELIRLGEFDDVDVAMLAHTEGGDGTWASVGDSHHGAIIKGAHFRGRTAHAGAAPWLGVNALKAATLALSAIDAQRETFPDSAAVRVHPIITKGGDAVTAVPSDVRVEMLIRARTMSDIADAEHKVDRALRAGALALGASVDIATIPGYFPLVQDPRLTRVVEENCVAVVGRPNMGVGRHRTGSTDMGDLARIMPVVQPRCGGASGTSHSSDYHVRDHRLAAVNPAKYMAMTVVDLLWDGAVEAKRVIEGAADSVVGKAAYLEERRSLDRLETYTYQV